MRPILGGVTRGVEAAAGRMAEGAALYVVCGLFLLCGLAALVVAAGIAIAEVYGAVAAWLSVAALCIILSGLAMVYAHLRRRARRLRAIQLQQASFSGAAGLGAAADVLPILLRTSPIGTLALVAAGAYLLAKAAQTDKSP